MKKIMVLILIYMIIIGKYLIDCQKYYSKIEPNIPMLQIPEITGNPSLYLYRINNLSSKTVDLGPSGNTRL